MLMTSPLWTAQEVQVATGGQFDRPWYADGLQVDSREVVVGDLFVALPGSDMDGHDYVADAFKRGAVAALVSTTNLAGVDPYDQRLMRTPDTMHALQRLALEARKRAPAKVIAVTGSVGKTTITHGLQHILSHQASSHGSVRSFNNQVGVPLSLARMPRDTRFAAFEAGMNTPGEIVERARLIRPDVAVVTTVGLAHRANFDSAEAIADEKASIFQGVVPGGAAVIGVDHDHHQRVVDRASACGLQRITVSAHAKADACVISTDQRGGEARVTADICGTIIDYALPHAGNIWVLNSLLMLASVHAAGGDVAHAAACLASVQPPAGRGRVHKLDWPVGEVTLVDDSYNANPQSMAAALERLALIAGEAQRPGRRIAILGNMLELGGDGARQHRALGAVCNQARVDLLITVGDDAHLIGEDCNAPQIKARSIIQARQLLMEHIAGGDTVLVKGSNASGLASLADLLKNTDRYSLDWPMAMEG